MLRKLFFSAFYLFSLGLSWAGEPVEETVICPVGGEEFTITGTMSCTTYGDIRTMSLRPVTSCEFATKLPVCPDNGLPMYQEFSKEQVSDLTVFLNTAEYAALRDLPPWLRAHGISRHLGQSGTKTAFNLLLSAMWHEPEQFFDNNFTLDQLIQETELELARSPEEDRPFLNAIAGYALAVAGRIEDSNKRLQRAKQTSGVSEFLLQYISAIENCQSDMRKEGCGPDDPFDPNSRLQ
jgi:hypothetical protein